MAKDARIALRTNIEQTRQNFHRVLNTIPEEALTQPSKDPAWTNGELLIQMCIAPRRMMSSMKNRVDQSWIYPPILKLFPKAFNENLNELYVRSRARVSTPLSLGIEFDKTCLFALKMLEEMWDQDFEKLLFVSDADGLVSGNVTRREAFDYLTCYFDTYSKQLDFNVKKHLSSAFQMTSNNPKREQSTGR